MGHDVLLAGIGGQGVVRTSYILGKSAFEQGMKVKVGDSHGSAMRGGSVIGQVRFGSEIFSPQIPDDQADILVALEPLEGIRNVSKYLSEGGLFLMNSRTLPPFDVQSSELEYPDLDEMKNVLEDGFRVKEFNSSEVAKKAGDARMVGIVMLGAISSVSGMGIDEQTFLSVIEEEFSEGKVEKNIEAFKLGRDYF